LHGYVAVEIESGQVTQCGRIYVELSHQLFSHYGR